MLDPKANKRPKTPVVVPSANFPGNLAMKPDAVRCDSKIRDRAYELYESRGREPGQDERDCSALRGNSSNRIDETTAFGSEERLEGELWLA